jgi:hypothetical protein
VILDSFSERTRANLEIALELACERLGEDGTSHESRKFVATRMIMAARNGVTGLAKLTNIAQSASRHLMTPGDSHAAAAKTLDR